MPGSSSELIAHLSSKEAQETLGVWACPVGDPTAQLDSMRKKYQAWLDCARGGSLWPRDICF